MTETTETTTDTATETASTGSTLFRAFAPELEVRAAAKGGDGRTIEGIVVPYDQPQRIHAELTEQFARGAFNAQLARPGRVKLSREHLSWGGTLIGRAHELRDDARGLWAALRVSATPAGDETLTLIEDQALDELSIGFREGRNRTLPDGTVVRVKADLREVAVVLAGAYGQKAKVSAVRAEQEAGDVDGELDGDPNTRPRLDAARQRLARLPILPLA